MLEKVSNVFYWTNDMDAAVAFYRDVLGLDPTLRAGEDWAEFDAGGVTVALHGTRGNAPPQGGATVVFEVADLERARRLLTERGAAFVGESGEADVGSFATFRDPDGNLLQIFERAHRHAVEE